MLKDCYRYFLPERRLVLKNPKTAAALEKVVPGVRDYPPPSKKGRQPISVEVLPAARP
jgi:hypothetical protein